MTAWPPPLARDLPKWPQMLTTGAPVTTDQAKEIIRRTDIFLIDGSGGNDHAWEAQLAARLRMPHYRDYAKAKPLASLKETLREQLKIQCQKDNWLEAWGAIMPEFVENDWISTAFMGGPHGWCWPDGRISFADNIGKWPSVEAVLRDWSTIAEAFPFLDLAATLMSGESCEDTVPIVTIIVKGGAARVEEGSLRFHAQYPAVVQRSDDGDDLTFDLAHSLNSEHGPIPDAWYAEWEQRAREMERR